MQKKIENDDVDLKEGLEGMAAAFHMAWMDWSKEIVNTEQISEKRLKRWQKFWVPYKQLPEEVKEQDRQYARIAFVMLSLGMSHEKEVKL